MAANTRSGPAQIDVYTTDATPVLDFSIGRDQQLEDATVTLELDTFEHTTQLSSRPYKYVRTGIEGTLGLSLSDITLANLALAYQEEIILDPATGSTKKKIEISDQAGKVITGRKVVIKPYDGDVLASAEYWITFLNGAIVDPSDTQLAFGLSTQQSINFALRSLPDPTRNNVRVVFGDDSFITP